MKKTISILCLMAIGGLFFLYNCSKDETKVAEVSGIVKLADGSVASGAIVKLSSEPNAASVKTTVVTDSAGKYVIIGVSEGTFYLSANYNTENTNNLKSSGIIFTTATDVQVNVSGSNVAQDITLTSKAASGSDVIDNTWSFDQTHSHLGFTFDYDSANAEFSGHFASYGLTEFKFDEANPANTKISAWVDITSTETGAPTIIDTIKMKTIVGGRDGLNGCISHTFGVEYNAADTFYKGYYRSTAIVGSTGKATFVSTSVAPYGDGYLAKGDLTFHKITKEVNLYFHYIPGFIAADRSGALNKYSSFAGMFEMKALLDFKISSGHVKSKPVHIAVNLQFYKKQ